MRGTTTVSCNCNKRGDNGIYQLEEKNCNFFFRIINMRIAYGSLMIFMFIQ